jgi:hypothetical protein
MFIENFSATNQVLHLFVTVKTHTTPQLSFLKSSNAGNILKLYLSHKDGVKSLHFSCSQTSFVKKK